MAIARCQINGIIGSQKTSSTKCELGGIGKNIFFGLCLFCILVGLDIERIGELDKKKIHTVRLNFFARGIHTLHGKSPFHQLKAIFRLKTLRQAKKIS